MTLNVSKHAGRMWHALAGVLDSAAEAHTSPSGPSAGMASTPVDGTLAPGDGQACRRRALLALQSGGGILANELYSGDDRLGQSEQRRGLRRRLYKRRQRVELLSDTKRFDRDLDTTRNRPVDIRIHRGITNHRHSDQSGANYQTLVTSARVVFFVAPSSFMCSSITGTITPVSGGVTVSLSANASSFPSATFEYTTWVPSGTTNYVITPDFSNVDNFQSPAMFELHNGANIVAQIGNSVYSPHTSITTAITGPNNAGGMASPFVTWLGNVGGAQTQTTFESLALSATTGAPAMIQSPTDYLSQTCNGSCALNSYFDAVVSG
jgi:hypothetical protein